jgi:hypothetical protein
VAAQAAKENDRLVLALAHVEEAEESLRSARELIRELFAFTLPPLASIERRRHGR